MEDKEFETTTGKRERLKGTGHLFAGTFSVILNDTATADYRYKGIWGAV